MKGMKRYLVTIVRTFEVTAESRDHAVADALWLNEDLGDEACATQDYQVEEVATDAKA